MELRSALRKAIVAKLNTDVELADLMGGTVTVLYRPTRQAIALPRIIMFDTGIKGDNIVPLFDRNHQIEIWDTDLDRAEEIAHRITSLLDHQPLPLFDDVLIPSYIPGDTGQVAFLNLVNDSDVPSEDGDLVRKLLQFRLLVYSYG